ncbi:MAG: type II secretion system protein [Candidatus Saccharibacteria bacterium]|nr:type II secretion system protein [Candidatus Saccharibacteria bacterium]
MKQRGFTIIELIIVIGVIAILATIGTIAWRSIRDGAKRDGIKANITRIKDAVDRYRRDNGEYPYENHTPPICSQQGDARECGQGELASLLVPRYIKELPKKDDGKHYVYRVRARNSANKAAFALLVSLPGGQDCKTGNNAPYSWWSHAPTCDF